MWKDVSFYKLQNEYGGDGFISKVWNVYYEVGHCILHGKDRM